MKLIAKLSAAFCALALVFAVWNIRTEEEKDTEKLKITLEVVQAYDTRLPTLTDTDFHLALDEMKRMIHAKLGDYVEIEFHDNGVVPLDKLFRETNYQTDDNEVYQKYLPVKYDIASRENNPVLKEDTFRDEVIRFLSRWDLNSLKGFFPDAKIEDYDDVFANLMDMYHKKIRWLGTLTTKQGEKLLIEPATAYQSAVEWYGFAAAQDKYDIIITNTLIINDLMTRPYPHSISKHAKIGGIALESRKRTPMNGLLLVANILEDYGEVEGISPSSAGEMTREMKSKILGGFLMAHEFGHAFYHLGDVYDHGDSCLMNSSAATNDDRLKGYRLLAKDDLPCPKCMPVITSQYYFIKAYRSEIAGRFNEAAELYLIARDKYPSENKANAEGAAKFVSGKVCELYKLAGNEAKVQEFCKD